MIQVGTNQRQRLSKITPKRLELVNPNTDIDSQSHTTLFHEKEIKKHKS